VYATTAELDSKDVPAEPQVIESKAQQLAATRARSLEAFHAEAIHELEIPAKGGVGAPSDYGLWI
jgi:hypothetical protein